MTDYNANAMTAGAVKELHAGLNVAIESYLQESTVSAVGQINMLRLPGGAEVVDVTLMVDGVPGTGLAVLDSHGNTYISTTTEADVPIRANANGLGHRLTSSAYVYIDQNGIMDAQAGADSAKYRLMVQYLSEKSGD